MQTLSWLINGERKLKELQTEAPSRGIEIVGVSKEDLRIALVNHEFARLAAAAPASVPAVALPVQPTVHVPTTHIPEEGIVIERRTEIHAVQEPPIKWLQRKFGKG